MHSTQRPPSSYGWIEQTTSRPATARDLTEERVFAPLPAADEEGPAGNRMRVEAQREARQRQLDESGAATHRAKGGFVAGMATPLNDTTAAELLAPPHFAAPERGPAKPPLGKLEWHVGAPDGAPPAGMSSQYSRPTARGMVAAPDSRQAASYNLQAKQLAGSPSGCKSALGAV